MNCASTIRRPASTLATVTCCLLLPFLCVPWPLGSNVFGCRIVAPNSFIRFPTAGSVCPRSTLRDCPSLKNNEFVTWGRFEYRILFNLSRINCCCCACQVGILQRANLSAGDIAQLADAVEPISFADGEGYIQEQMSENTRNTPTHEKSARGAYSYIDRRSRQVTCNPG